MISVLAAICAGCASGFLYAFSGFNADKETATLDKNPRVHNLKYVLAVLPTVLVADIAKMGGGLTNPDTHFHLTLWYVGTTIVVAGFFIGITALILAVKDWKLACADGYESISSQNLVVTYLHHGFAAYRKAKEQAINDARNEHSHSLPAHEALWNFNGLMIATRRYERQPTETLRESVINEILKAMSTAAKAYLSHVPKAKFASNYMLPVPVAQATERHLACIKFNDGIAGCSHLLVLVAYEDGNVGAPMVSLPIREPRDYVLPGAPEAFVTLLKTSLSRNVSFAGASSTQVPRDIQQQMRDYFEGARFESFISLPLMRDKHCVGIVNIDSIDADAFANQEYTERLVRALQPHCTLLASMCGAGELG